MKRPESLLCWITLCLTVAAWGQAPSAAADGPEAEVKASQAASEDSLIQLTFPENIEVKVLVDYVSRRLGMNILYDESKVRKRVTIVSPTKIPKDSLLGFLRSVLKMSGLALVEADQPGWRKVVESGDLQNLSDRITDDPEALTAMGPTAVVTRQFALEHTTPAAVEQTIRPFLSKPGGNSFAIADRGLLFVTDYADVLRRIAPLVAMMDRPSPEPRLTFVR